jgi:ubiquinone/menaquinone biosynthesis C-methylase UbiE
MDRREFFDRSAADWDRHMSEDVLARLKRVIDEAQLHAGDCVLDVGTGTGVLIPLIAEAIAPEGILVASDISLPMLLEAHERMPDERVLLVQADVHHLPVFSRRFDRVVCNAALPHFGDRHAALQEMVGSLRAGGLIIISHPIGREAVNLRHREAGGPVGEDRVPPADKMEALLQKAELVEVVVIDEPDFYLARGRKA